jgi:hypothetical protein
VLIFAFLVPEEVPAHLQAHIDQQHPVRTDLCVYVTVTDPQGLPIEHAQIISHAAMTNMEMGNEPTSIQSLGHGQYIIMYHLSMTGPWAIHITMRASGFEPLQHALLVHI